MVILWVSGEEGAGHRIVVLAIVCLPASCSTPRRMSSLLGVMGRPRADGGTEQDGVLISAVEVDRPGRDVEKTSRRVPAGGVRIERRSISQAEFAGRDDQVRIGDVRVRPVPDPGRHEERIGKGRPRLPGSDQGGRLRPVRVGWKPRDLIEGVDDGAVGMVRHRSSLMCTKRKLRWSVSDATTRCRAPVTDPLVVTKPAGSA